MKSVEKIYNKMKQIKIVRKFMGWQELLNFHGNYQTWKEAEKICVGYNSEIIFNKVKNAAIQVKAGKANYERDGVLFYEKKVNYQLVAYLLQIVIRGQGKLNVLDWGGSLGSTYFQNREMLLKYTKEFNWTIIEQNHFVKFGTEFLRDEVLDFVESFEDVKNIQDYNCVLLASVLQYLDFYETVIKKVTSIAAQYIIVERTPVSYKKRIAIEEVHEPIYEASYPIIIFEEKNIIKLFENEKYQLLDSFESNISKEFMCDELPVKWKTFVFEKQVDRERNS